MYQGVLWCFSSVLNTKQHLFKDLEQNVGKLLIQAWITLACGQQLVLLRLTSSRQDRRQPSCDQFVTTLTSKSLAPDNVVFSLFCKTFPWPYCTQRRTLLCVVIFLFLQLTTSPLILRQVRYFPWKKDLTSLAEMELVIQRNRPTNLSPVFFGAGIVCFLFKSWKLMWYWRLMWQLLPTLPWKGRVLCF